MAVGGFGEQVPLSITCPKLSSLLQGSGVMTHRTPNVVSGIMCGMGGVGVVWGLDPHVSPQCPAEGTLGSISEAVVGSVASRRAISPISLMV